MKSVVVVVGCIEASRRRWQGLLKKVDPYADRRWRIYWRETEKQKANRNRRKRVRKQQTESCTSLAFSTQNNKETMVAVFLFLTTTFPSGNRKWQFKKIALSDDYS